MNLLSIERWIEALKNVRLELLARGLAMLSIVGNSRRRGHEKWAVGQTPETEEQRPLVSSFAHYLGVLSENSLRFGGYCAKVPKFGLLEEIIGICVNGVGLAGEDNLGPEDASTYGTVSGITGVAK